MLACGCVGEKIRGVRHRREAEALAPTRLVTSLEEAQRTRRLKRGHETSDVNH